jgi:hypothetical protein
VSDFGSYADACPKRIVLPIERRPGNALNVEIGQPMDRCRLRPPSHWPEGMVGRWLASGGSALVLGVCCAARCPLKPTIVSDDT